MSNKKLFLTKKDNLFVDDSENLKVYSVDDLDRNCGLVVDIDPTVTEQKIEGFGAALSGSSCYNLYKMSDKQREDALNSLFSAEKGIDLNISRQAIGVTDFAYEYYTYDDIPEGETDFDLKYFSIEKDFEYIIPQIKKAQEIHPGLKICGGVWSPPLWMKSKYSWGTEPENKDHSIPPTLQNTAMLKPECYDVYAQYLVKFIRAYEAEGIHFDFLTVQNEPFGRHDIPACYYDKDTMANVINNHVLPLFKKEGITTKVFAYDFNLWTDTAIEYITPTKDTVSGIAMHYYGNEFRAVQNVHNAFKDLPLVITECGSPYERRYDDVMDPVLATIGDMCSALRYGASAYIRWNYVLDHKGGPSDPHNRNFVCEGILTYNTDENKVYFGSAYYAMQHFSRFIKPGAVQIASTDLNDDEARKHYAFAAMNQDGSKVVVLANTTDTDEIYKAVLDGNVYEYDLPARSVVSIVI